MIIPNKERGCGRVVRGGYYAIGQRSRDGILAPIIYALGTHMENEMLEPQLNLVVNPKARGIEYFNPILSIQRNDMFLVDINDPPVTLLNVPIQLSWLGSVALLDHVGKKHYPTPWSFVEELIEMGPSRHIPGHVARKISPIVPLPIFFSHSIMPWTRNGDDAFSLMESFELNHEDFSASPTWMNKNWSGVSKSRNPKAYHGEDHYVVELMRRQHDGSYSPYMVKEAVFVVSWITNIVRIGLENETENDFMRSNPQDVQAGIDFAYLEE